MKINYISDGSKLMSGYDPKNNIFGLTATKIRQWLRRDKLPEDMH